MMSWNNGGRLRGREETRSPSSVRVRKVLVVAMVEPGEDRPPGCSRLKVLSSMFERTPDRSASE